MLVRMEKFLEGKIIKWIVKNIIYKWLLINDINLGLIYILL